MKNQKGFENSGFEKIKFFLILCLLVFLPFIKQFKEAVHILRLPETYTNFINSLKTDDELHPEYSLIKKQFGKESNIGVLLSTNNSINQSMADDYFLEYRMSPFILDGHQPTNHAFIIGFFQDKLSVHYYTNLYNLKIFATYSNIDSVSTESHTNYIFLMKGI